MKAVTPGVQLPKRPLPPFLSLDLVLWGRPVPSPGDRPIRCRALVFPHAHVVLLQTEGQVLAPSYLVEARQRLLIVLPLREARLLLVDCQQAGSIAEVSGSRGQAGTLRLVSTYLPSQTYRQLYTTLMKAVLIGPDVPYQALFSNN